jgi:hypothetical protein
MHKTFIAFFLATVALLGGIEVQAASTHNNSHKTGPRIVGKPIQSRDVNLKEFHERHNEAIPREGVTGKKVKSQASKALPKKGMKGNKVGCTDGKYNPYCNSEKQLPKITN